MTKFLSFIGTQSAILISGAVLGMLLGWTPEYAASITVAVQMFVLGYSARGWFENNS